jgi:hypothetical protein
VNVKYELFSSQPGLCLGLGLLNFLHTIQTMIAPKMKTMLNEMITSRHLKGSVSTPMQAPLAAAKKKHHAGLWLLWSSFALAPISRLRSIPVSSGRPIIFIRSLGQLTLWVSRRQLLPREGKRSAQSHG